METQIHPFEAAGMGRGPYRFVAAWSFPSPALAEQNPSAYQNAMADMPRGLRGGCGTCANCGMGIMNVYIVADADGNRYGVGCDCVEKTGDKALGDMVKIEVARHNRELARARREAKRAAQHAIWLDTECKTGETNRVRLLREDREAQAAAAQRAKEATRIAATLSELINVLEDGRGGFRDSVARDLRNGNKLFGRGLDITLDIFAKAFGRYGSKAYDEARARALEFYTAAHPE